MTNFKYALFKVEYVKAYQRKKHLLLNKCLCVGGDVLDLTWAEHERGAVPITHLRSQVSPYSSLFFLVFQKTAFPRLHCLLIWGWVWPVGNIGCRWEAQFKFPLPFICLGSTAGNGLDSSMAPASARHILYDFSFNLVVLG